MSETISTLPFGMRPEVARRRIEVFRKRYGNAHLYLAYHAAFPIALTPDLVYRLRATFQRDVYGELLNIPWIAVADLLLSSLCEEVGYELYEMNVAVRHELLSQLRQHENFGEQRISELSNFLLKYVHQQLNSHDPDTRDFAHAQYWTALVATRPEEAAHSIALTLSKLDPRDRAGFARMKSLIETLGEPSDEFATLLAYTKSMELYARGNEEQARVELDMVSSTTPKRGRSVDVRGVDLPIPRDLWLRVEETIKATFSEPSVIGEPVESESVRLKDCLINYHNTDNDWALWIQWQIEEAGYSVALQPWNFQLGANFAVEMEKATRLSNRIIPLYSKNYLDALSKMPGWNTAFLQTPNQGRGLLLPIRVYECNPDALLGPTDYLDLVGLNVQEAQEQIRQFAYRNFGAVKPLPDGELDIEHSTPEQPALPLALFPTPQPIPSPRKPEQAIEIFIAYAHADERMRDELEQYLTPLQRQGLISIWHDRQISVEAEWEREIYKHLNTAQIILLLISPDFIASDFCYSVEMKRALERRDAGECTVVPIILRPVSWQATPFAKLQVLPADGRPITSRSNRDEAFFEVTRGIEEVIKKFRKTVFVSYSRADGAFVIRLKNDLEAAGITTTGIEGIQIGTPDWDEATRTAIDSADAVLFIASPDARQSAYVRDELHVATSYGRPVYPIWAAGTAWLDSVPSGFGASQFLDARGERYESTLKTLIRTIRDSRSVAKSNIEVESAVPPGSAPTGVPSVEVVSNIHSNKQSMPLTKNVISIGRDPSNDVVLTEQVVSGFHAQIVREGNQYVFVHPHPQARNGHTLNGIIYQGRHIKGDEQFRKPLARGDFFRIGDEHGTLVTISYNDGSGVAQDFVPEIRPISLGAPVITIGRLLDNTVVLDHRQVSGHHARLELGQGSYRIIDMDSTNHVYVDGKRVTNQLLKPGDDIRIGPYNLIYTGTQLTPREEQDTPATVFHNASSGATQDIEPENSSGPLEASGKTAAISTPAPSEETPAGRQPRQLIPGTELSGGRYKIERLIAVGSSRAVYLATDQRFNRPCTVKEMLDDFQNETERAQAIEWFQREATLLLSLNHPCIPIIRDFFDQNGKNYLVMDFIEGRTLAEILAKEGNVIGLDGARGVSEARARNWARQICSVLAYLHSQNPPIIFRDLKPSNIMVTTRGEIKLIDFGIARTFQSQRQSTIIMTIGYAPPEQMHGNTEPRSDLYALGATIHRVLTQHDPANNKPDLFSFPIIRSLRPDVSVAFDRIIMKALAPRVADRWSSATEMERAIINLPPITVQPPDSSLPEIDLAAPIESQTPDSGSGTAGPAGSLIRAAQEHLLDGRIEPAFAVVQQAFALEPNNALVHKIYGQVFARRQPPEPNLAIQAYIRSLQLDPNDAETHKLIGDVYLYLRKVPTQAIQLYTQSLRLNPDDFETHQRLAKCYESTGRLDAALNEYQEAVRLNFNRVDPHFDLGQLALRLNQLPMAERAFVQVLTLEPAFHDARFLLSQVYEREGKLADALRECSYVVQALPDNPAAQTMLKRLSAPDERGSRF